MKAGRLTGRADCGKNERMQGIRIVKRLGQVLVLLVLLVGLVLGSVSFWGPAVMGMVVRWSGMEWEAAGLEREGWSGWRWERVRVAGDWGTVDVAAARLPQLWPLVGWWMLDLDPVEVTAETVTVVLAKQGKNGSKAEGMALPEPATVGKWLGEGQRWLERLPRVEVGALRVEGADGLVVAGVRGMEAEAGDIRWRMTQPGLVDGLESWLVTGGESDVRWLGRLPSAELEWELRLRQGGNGLNGDIVLQSGGEPLEAEWHYEEQRQSLAVRAEEWPVPQALFPSDWPRMARMVAGVDGYWDAEGYRLAGELRGETDSFWGELMRAEVDLRGRGKEMRVGKLLIRTDWLRMDLTNPVGFDWARLRADNAAELTVEAVLEEQQLWPLRGRLSGRARITEPRPGPMEVDFKVEGESIRWRDLPAASVEMEGRFHDRKVEATRLRAFWGEETELDLRGQVSLRPDRRLEADIGARLGGEVREILPEALRSVGLIELEARVEGDWRNPQHSGNATVRELDLPQVKPLDWELDWSGVGTKEAAGVVRARLGQRDLMELQAAVQAGESNGPVITVKSGWLALGEEQQPLRIQEPLRVSLGGAESAGGLPTVSPLRLGTGDGSLVEAEWNAAAEAEQELDILVRELGSDWLNRILEKPLPDVAIGLLDMSVRRGQSGWLTGHFEVGASSGEVAGRPLQLNGRLVAEEDGFQLQEWTLGRAGQQLVEGGMEIPFRLGMREFPGGPWRWEWREGRQMEGTLRIRIPEDGLAEAEKFAWAAGLAGLSGEVELSGDAQRPQARVELQLPRTRGWGEWGAVLQDHPLEDLRLTADWNRKRLRVDNLRGSWAGSALSLSGDLPQPALLAALRDGENGVGKLVESLRGRLRLEELELEKLADLLPLMVRPAGSVEADLTMGPGIELSGRVRASGLGLRSTLYTAPVEDMELEAEASGKSLKIVRGGGRIGSGELSVSGELGWGGGHAGLRYDLRMQGERLPLARTPELLVRSDLDLHLTKEGEEPARLSGSVALRDSVVLVEMNPLAARTRGGPAQQPPYFAVEASPYRDWELGIEITGEEAVQVRGPYVETVLSVRAGLEGRLADPLLLGTVRTEEGALVFPATRLRLGRGNIFIERDDPHQLQLDLRAHGQTASHVISLEVGGTAAEPRLQLTATPELEQARILRLLTTGSLQGGGLGSLGLYLGRGLVGPGGGGGGWLERFSVEVGREVSESGRDTIDLYYEFTDDLYLHGQYDEYDEQNLDFVWEVYEK